VVTLASSGILPLFWVCGDDECGNVRGCGTLLCSRNRSVMFQFVVCRACFVWNCEVFSLFFHF